MHYELIVIGMGLSGLMAAKTAADLGKKTLIIGTGMGSLSLFSNTIDLLGSLPEKDRTSHGLSQWVKDHPDHPYAKAGSEEVEESLASFLSFFSPPYSFQVAEKGNYQIPTGAGTFRPAYAVPPTMIAGTSLKEGDGLIVGFEGFKDFYARFAADRLKCRSLNLPFSENGSHAMTASGLARLFEQKPFRNAVGAEIKKHLRGETRVGLPALLGIHDPMIVKNNLEAIIGAEVFEIPILPPSIPGLRIFNRFKEWLIRKGVTFLLGYSVSKAHLNGKRCDKIEVSHAPVSNFYSADCYIVATGRFLGGGLIAEKERILEPVFHLPVSQPGSREQWYGRSFFDPSGHPLQQAGIVIDHSFMPIDEKGKSLIENVRIAGTILAHHDVMNEKSKEGIEIATGYWAVKKAFEK